MRKRNNSDLAVLGRTMLVCVILMLIVLSACEKECLHEYHSEITVSAQCQQDGMRTYTCNLCKHSYTEVIAALEHEFDGGKITKESTCVEQGTKTYTCNLCGEKKDEAIAAIAHAYGEPTVTQAATCTEEGVMTTACTVCGASYQEPIEKIQHSCGTPYVKLAATCAVEGERYADCTMCGAAVFIEAIPKTDEHQFENTVLREPSCADPGEGKNTCSICGYSESCSYELLDHEYNEGSITVQPSCASAGKKEYACVNCGHNKEEEVPTTEHEYEFIEEREPGTHHVGYRQYRCKHCGATKKDLFGKHGDYDFQAIADAFNEYAAELGFHVIVSTARSGTEMKHNEMVFYAELCGGQEHLIKKAKELVDYQYQELTYRGRDSSEFYIWVIVEYSSNASMGSGYFHIYSYRQFPSLMEE